MNTPLSSNELARILIFTLFLLPIIGLGVGVIPVIFLIFGIVLMKKTQKFSHIETAVKNFKIYMQIAFFIGMLFTIYWVIICFINKYNGDDYSSDGKSFVASALFSLVPVIYIILINELFFKPISSHSDWLEKHGFFPKMIEIKNESKDVDIIRGEKFRSYSVADELTKWAQLKVDGHISEEEFEEARRKLLKK